MTMDAIIEAATAEPVARISRDDLDSLLETSELLRETRTGIAGTIRTLRLKNRLFVQERNPEGDHFLRRFPSEESAARFIDDRLASYERMWDG